MKKRHLIPFLAVAALALGCMLMPALAGGAPRVLRVPAGLEEADGQFMLDTAEPGPGHAPPDLGVVVAAPRAAITGRGSGILLVERPGRRLNVEEGETVRFVSGIREAVWYAGRGLVASALALLRPDPAGGDLVTLGRDALELRGAAPAIDHGRVHVDMTFNEPGVFEVIAHVRAAATPKEGRRTSRSARVPYQVHVWEPGQLGAIAGFVGRDSDGAPLEGLTVVVLQAATGEPVNAARTRCDGTYLVDRLPAGEYLIGVPSRRGFEGEFWDDATDPASAISIALAAGEAVQGIDLLLARR
jgi:hypothetical protein